MLKAVININLNQMLDKKVVEVKRNQNQEYTTEGNDIFGLDRAKHILGRLCIWAKSTDIT